MSKTKHQKPRDKHNKDNKNKYKPRKDNMYRGGKQYTYKELRDMHVYVPPNQSTTNGITTLIENHNPARVFTLAPCQSCGSNVDNDSCAGHEHPIVIGVGSKGKNAAACGVFCNLSSAYNTSFILNDEKLEHHEIELHSAVAALKLVATFMAANLKRRDIEYKDTKQIIIKTSSSWLVHKFTAASREHFRYKHLSCEFDDLVDRLGKFTGVRPIVKFWKFAALRWLSNLLKRHSGDGRRYRMRLNQEARVRAKQMIKCLVSPETECRDPNPMLLVDVLEGWQ